MEHRLGNKFKHTGAKFGRTKQLQKTRQQLTEAHRKIGRMYETQRNLLDQIHAFSVNENNHDCQAAIASIEHEKNHVKAELVALQKHNEAVILEKGKLANDNLVLKQSNERLHNEIGKIGIELKKRNNELIQMTDEFSNTKIRLETTRQIAAKYMKQFSELQEKHNGLVAEHAATQSCHPNASTQTDESLNASTELNSTIAEKQQQNELLRAENGKLSKRLSELDAKHTTAMNTIHTLIEEKKEVTSKLSAFGIQSEFRFKSSIDKDKENGVAMVQLTHENDTFQTPILQKRRRLANVTSVPDAGLTTNAKSITDAALTHPLQHTSFGINRTNSNNPSTSGNLHPNVRKRAMEPDRPSKETKITSVPAQKPQSFKWCCNSCSASFEDLNLVKAHLTRTHRYPHLIHQFECKLCPFLNNSISNIKSHMITAHAESDMSQVKCNYKRMPM